jgi:transcriptional regulator GlxA family with amidase domain
LTARDKRSQAAATAAPAETDAVQRVTLLLVPGFALMSYSSALEPFRAANALAGRTLYRWRNISVDGEPVMASSGLEVAVEGGLDPTDDADMVLVCAGGNPALFDDASAFAWLRSMASRGATIGGVSGGPYIIAKAGLLDGCRATVHWEHAPAFHEAFPAVQLIASLYQIDGRRMTCAGGVAALDLMHQVIASRHGPDLARAVSDWFLQAHVRPGSGGQRLGARERLGIVNRKLEGIVDRMERRLEEPLTRQDLAADAGISLRQLDRLFQAHLGLSVDRFYTGLRLDRARELLRQTSLPVMEIAVATGFASASHFSRSYRDRFGAPPRAERSPVSAPR